MASVESGYAGLAKDGEEIYFVPTQDVDSIAALLVRLADDPDLRERAGRAARRFAEGYSWEHYRANFSRILDERILPSLGGSMPGGT